MADVRPFRGLRFDPQRVPLGDTVCPPYDVMTPAEQRAYHEREPHNIIRVELGLGPADPSAPGNRYSSAAEALAAWQREGVLIQEAQPALYLHEQRFTIAGRDYVRRGLIVVGRLHEWGEGQVLPHEGTRSGPKQDRLALMQATHANVSPLWLLYKDEAGTINGALQAAWQAPPTVEAVSDGEAHALRVVTDLATIRAVVAAFAKRPLFIADGHHRYETAQIYRNEQRQRAASDGKPADPDAGYEFAMMLVMALDDPGLVVLPTHRLVRGFNRPLDEVRQALACWFTLASLDLPGGDEAAVGAAMEQALAQAGQTQAHVFGLMEGDRAWLLTPRNDANWQERLPVGHSAAWRELDVAILDGLAIREVCGIRAEGESAGADATSHAPSDRLAYVSDFAGAVRAARSGEAQQVYFLNPTRVEQVCAVAVERDRMPPKSTYFYPKPVTGLVLHPLNGERRVP